MPYLHWETDEAREKMRLVINDILEPNAYALKGTKISAMNLSRWGRKLIPKLVMLSRQRHADAADADEKLLRAHLQGERPVHVRRTLDQSYYWTLRDTQTRDRDQVVYRATNKTHQNPRQPRIVMVDQLWLWILDGSELKPNIRCSLLTSR